MYACNKIKGNPVKRFLSVVSFVFGLAATGAALAETDIDTYPNKPIEIIIPYQAGGGTDQILRVVAPKVSEILDTPIVILNRPGASTVIGMRALIQAKPDGYTLVFSTNTSFSLIPYTQNPKPYDPNTDIEYITVLGETPMIFTTHPKFASNFQDFLSKVKDKPGHYAFATYGIGGITHLAAEVLLADMDIKLTQVPYKGYEAITALAGGQIDSMVDGVNAPATMIEAGKIIPMVTLQHTRTKFLPDTPTLTEIGYPDASTSTISYLLAAPKNTPTSVIDKIYLAFAEAMQDPDTIKKIEMTKSSPMHFTPTETKEYIDAQVEQFTRIIKERDIKFN